MMDKLVKLSSLEALLLFVLLGGCVSNLDKDVLVQHPIVVADWQEQVWHVEEIGVDLSATTKAKGIVSGVLVVKLPIEIADGVCITRTTTYVLDPKGDRKQGRVFDSVYEQMTGNYMSLPEHVGESCIDRDFRKRYMHLPSLVEPDIVGEIQSLVASDFCKLDECYVSEISSEFGNFEGVRFIYKVTINSQKTGEGTFHLILSREDGALRIDDKGKIIH